MRTKSGQRGWRGRLVLVASALAAAPILADDGYVRLGDELVIEATGPGSEGKVWTAYFVGQPETNVVYLGPRQNSSSRKTIFRIVGRNEVNGSLIRDGMLVDLQVSGRYLDGSFSADSRAGSLVHNSIRSLQPFKLITNGGQPLRRNDVFWLKMPTTTHNYGIGLCGGTMPNLCLAEYLQSTWKATRGPAPAPAPAPAPPQGNSGGPQSTPQPSGPIGGGTVSITNEQPGSAIVIYGQNTTGSRKNCNIAVSWAYDSFGEVKTGSQNFVAVLEADGATRQIFRLSGSYVNLRITNGPTHSCQ